MTRRAWILWGVIGAWSLTGCGRDQQAELNENAMSSYQPAEGSMPRKEVNLDSIDIWLKKLDDDDANMRLRAAEEISKYGAEAVPPLISALKSDIETRRIGASIALFELGPHAKSAVPALVDTLQNSKGTLRDTTVLALTQVGIDSSSVGATQALLFAMKAEVKEVREGAAILLLQIGSAAVSPLIDSLDDQDESVRASAAVVLEALAPDSIPELVMALKSKRPEVVPVLELIGEPAVPALIDTLKDDRAVVRALAAITLGKIGVEAKDAWPALTDALKDDVVDVRRECAKALLEIGPVTIQTVNGVKRISSARPSSSMPQTSDRTSQKLPTRAVDHGIVTNTIGMQLKLITRGEFLMGSASADETSEADERPHHTVRISRNYYLGVYEVTQGEYIDVMGNNPSEFTTDSRRPVENISWFDAIEFCNSLSEAEGLSTYYSIEGTLVTLLGGDGYRLPTEAEWEYACRAGGRTTFTFGDDPGQLPDYAWFRDNSGNTTHRVGQKKSNAWGLYDMHGNVGEWCWDFYSKDYYTQLLLAPGQRGIAIDPTGPASAPKSREPASLAAFGAERIVRGGAWYAMKHLCTSSRRVYHQERTRTSGIGIRVARTARVSEPGGGPSIPDATKNKRPAASEIMDVTNSVSMKFVHIPPGQFQMGDDQKMFLFLPPQYHTHLHRVRITMPLYVGVHEVTQQHYEKVMGENPSRFKGDPNCPVERVSWFDAIRFCNRLSELERLTPYYWIENELVAVRGGYGYRLPTEAEWEYVCRSGNSDIYYYGRDPSELREFAWFGGNSNKRTHPVGFKYANRWGIFDMYGNVAEWCWDWHREDYYQQSTERDPLGPSDGSFRVIRGGGWKDSEWLCRSAARNGAKQNTLISFLGFRVVRTSEWKPNLTPAIKFVSIPPGEFQMGARDTDHDASMDEKPNHLVQITRPFILGAHEVTQEQFAGVMGKNPSSSLGDGRRPVEGVSWFDAIRFCNRLSELEGLEPYYEIDVERAAKLEYLILPGIGDLSAVTAVGGYGYRLPTEAEWEYACRAGSTSPYFFGDDSEQLGRYAWFGDTRDPHPVGQKEPNAWGLFDMHGNVSEWCNDWYAKDYFGESPKEDPPGPSLGRSGPSTQIDSKVVRGGHCFTSADRCRSSYRYHKSPGRGVSGRLGFRVARTSQE